MALFLLGCGLMRYLASLALILTLATGCTLIFDDDGGDDCLIAEPASLPAPQRNPDTLACESFGGFPCNPECGPCPAVATAPQPSWGFCGSTCESLSETDCAKAAECRVVKDAACAVRGNCTTEYLGCFPTDQFTDPQLDCFAARDGYSCSQSASCVAFHRGPKTALEPAITRTFAMCAPEDKTPGKCFAPVTCLRPSPACPANTMPGVDGGCYTGACIPTDVCEPNPQP